MADVVPTEGLTNLLNLLVGSASPITVRLAKNSPALSPATVLGDFTEADFSGYAPVTVSPLSPPAVTVNGKVRSQGLPAVFAHNGGPTSNTISVYYVTLETLSGPQLLWAGPVEDAPKTMATVDDVIDMTIEIRETQEV